MHYSDYIDLIEYFVIQLTFNSLSTVHVTTQILFSHNFIDLSLKLLIPRMPFRTYSFISGPLERLTY